MKIRVISLGSAPPEQVERNQAHARGLGYPKLGVAESPRLAVVGGGPSIKTKVDELRAFDGEIWAINGAFKWCVEHGIDATFFSVDPLPVVAEMVSGVKRAVLSTTCDPSVFAALEGAQVEAVTYEGDGAIPSGPTTSTCAPYIALHRGHREIVFYGCESSYTGQTHIYGDYLMDDLLLVQCNGEQFYSSPDLVMQAQHLGAIIRAFPNVFSERSGGLLSACVADSEVDWLAGTPALHKALFKEAS